MSLLLDLAFIPKACIPETYEGLKENQTHPSQEETLFINETTGIIIHYSTVMYVLM